MKFKKLSKAEGLKIIKKSHRKLVFIALLLVFLYFCFYLYQNLYLTIIHPPALDLNQVSQKEIKINTNLYQKAMENRKIRQETEAAKFMDLKNPFVF